MCHKATYKAESLSLLQRNNQTTSLLKLFKKYSKCAVMDFVLPK